VPGENFSRRVARAAAVGGGRTYRSQTPRGWFAMLLVICLVGVGLVAYSRYERTVPPPSAAHKPTVPPTTADEWQAAFAVDVCGRIVPNALPTTVTSLVGSGWETLAGGIADLEPARATLAVNVEGARATLASYLAAEGIGVNAKSLTIPGVPKKPATSTTTSTSSTTTSTSSTTTTTVKSGSKASSTTTTTTVAPTTTTTTTVPTLGPNRTYVVGKNTCSGSTGEVMAEVWKSPGATKGTIVPADKLGSLKFENGELVTVAFVAKGTTSLPKPPGVHTVEQFLKANPLGRVTQPVTPSSTIVPSSSVPATSTTAPSSSSSTTTTSASSSSSTTSTSKP